MLYSDIIALSYCGNGPEKLAKAVKLYSDHGEMLLAKEAICASLLSLKVAVNALDSHMMVMNMGASCSVCAATVNGGCCSAYMGHENNDVLQLLMNMLAGIDVACVRDDDIECCFLAERGCLLLFKPIFCLNYLCERIRISSTEKELQILEKRTGELLRTQVELEGIVITALQK